MTGATDSRARVYIAGPIRSSGEYVENVARAVEAAQAIYEAGHAPFIPHTHNLLWELKFPKDRDALVEADCRWLEACDALVRLTGESVGADREVAYAEECGIPVYHGVEDFLEAAALRTDGGRECPGRSNAPHRCPACGSTMRRFSDGSRVCVKCLQRHLAGRGRRRCRSG